MSRSPTDSYAPVTSTMVFTTTGGKQIPIPTHQYLQSIEIEQFSEGGWKGTVELFDPDGDFLEALIIEGGPNSKLSFRYGFESDGINNLPLHVGAILKAEPSFTPQGVAYALEVVCRENLVSVLDKQSRSFAAGKTATDIFRVIAEARNWTLIDRNGNSTVGESTGTLDSFATVGESDVAFLLKKILPRCHDSQGVGFVFFFDVDNVAHWHSINYGQSVGGAPSQSVKQYQFARDQNGEVISFKPKDNVIGTVLRGAGNAAYPGLDSLNGVAAEKGATKLAGPEGTKMTGVDGAIFRPVLPNTLHSRDPIITRDVDELAHIVAARYSRLAIQTYTAELEVKGTHAARPWDYVSVRWVKKDGSDHYLGGVFLVTKVHHHFTTGGFLTSMELARLGHGYTQGSDKLDVSRNAVVKAGTSATSETQTVPVQAGGSTSRSLPK